MKKILQMLVATAMALTAIPALAAVNGTPHDFLGTTAHGRCEECHVPHAASSKTAKRLWREDRTITKDGTWSGSTVGTLCGTCHDGGASNVDKNTGGTLPNTVTGTVYSKNSHARSWTVLKGANTLTQLGNSGVADNPGGYPYAGTNLTGAPEANRIECTSCHNVHDNTVQPFLRTGVGIANMIDVCNNCHSDRLSITITTKGAQYSDPPTATTNGNHPSAVHYVDNGGTGVDNGPTALHNPKNLDNGVALPNAAWSLGGKFMSPVTFLPPAVSNSVTPGATWDIGCQTCHSIHKPATATFGGSSSYMGLHLLSVENIGMSGYATLCESCHGGGETRGGNAASTPATPHVGTAGSDHPIDQYGVTTMTIDNWFVVGARLRAERNVGTNIWPRSVTGNNIMCTSCHSAHNSNTTLGFLKRKNGDVTDWCLSCHSSASPLGHHSNTLNWGSSAITCNDCHQFSRESSGGHAHNGFSFLFGDRRNQLSNLCTQCHTGTSTASANPVAAVNATDPVYATVPNSHLGGFGQANKVSHFLGQFTNAALDINVKTGAWGSGGTGGYSKFGAPREVNGFGSKTDTAGFAGYSVAGTGPNRLICESCHSVLYNIGNGVGATTASGYNNNLLLQDYIDDSENTGAARAVGSGLCVACHNSGNANAIAAGAASGSGFVSASIVRSSNGAWGNYSGVAPRGLHPMTGWKITRAVDAGRTQTTLSTNQTINYATAAGAPAAGGGIGGGSGLGKVSYPATDTMDCDSCHRPHQAPVGATYTRTQTNNGVIIPVIIENAPTANEFGDLCQTCHAM